MKTVLITGCSSGIGLDAARTLHRRGWRVFATCRREEDSATLRSEGLESFRLDYTDPASIGAAMAETLDRCDGALDALFNNGAHALPGAVEDLGYEALEAIFRANLFGPHELARRAVRVMRERGQGRIVNCSSVLGFAYLRFRGAYTATKHAMEGLTDTLRLELRGTPIRGCAHPPRTDPHFDPREFASALREVDRQGEQRVAGILRHGSRTPPLRSGAAPGSGGTRPGGRDRQADPRAREPEAQGALLCDRGRPMSRACSAFSCRPALATGCWNATRERSGSLCQHAFRLRPAPSPAQRAGSSGCARCRSAG